MRGHTVREWTPFLSPKTLDKLMDPARVITADECLAMDIPDQEKIYLLTREEYLPWRDLQLLACRGVERVLHVSEDPRLREAVEIKRLWIDGKVPEERLREAEDSIADAVESALDQRYRVERTRRTRGAGRLERAEAAEDAAFAVEWLLGASHWMTLRYTVAAAGAAAGGRLARGNERKRNAAVNEGEKAEEAAIVDLIREAIKASNGCIERRNSL